MTTALSNRGCFDEKVGVLLAVMAEAGEHGVLEVTEPDCPKAVRKALPPSRRSGAQSERKVVVSTVQQFEVFGRQEETSEKRWSPSPTVSPSPLSHMA